MTRSVQPILELKNVTRRFGGLLAVNDLSMSVEPGKIHGLIGPNGAGKSTVFDLVSGLTKVTAGKIVLDGSDITSTSPEDRVKLGICRTFQTPRLFELMTSLETVMAGRHLHGKTGFWGSVFGAGAKSRDESAIRKSALGLLDLVGLGDDAAVPVTRLSYGKRRLIEIARALATEPQLLLLDEVASGLNPSETAAVARLIRELVSGGLSVILVEHDMTFVMELCGSITVLNFGARVADGPPAQIVKNSAVVTAYLGEPRPEGVSRRAIRRAGAIPAQTIPLRKQS
jgi:branched-chain amino acid transport system ATP-binding protein